nr:TetR/AcrR family transcriptional regulator [Paenibacillus hamazuiensis]
MRVQQIIRAAAEVYLDKGYVMEMRDVAVHAGLGYGTVYHYYRNKLQLFDDLFHHALDQAKTVIHHASENNQGTELKEICKRLVQLWVKEPAVFILYKMVAENFHQLPDERYDLVLARFQEELYRPMVEAMQRHDFNEKRKRANAGNGFEAQSGNNPNEWAERRINAMIGALVGCAGLYIHHRNDAKHLDEVVDVLFAGFGVSEAEL